MEQKLLLVTSGTIAAGVGQEFVRQMNVRPQRAKKLQALVRSIDTTHLPTTYTDLLNGEWFPMSINPQFIDSIQENVDVHFPELKNILYPHLLPETTMAGGGGIRYNGAGAVILNHDHLQEWLKQSFTDLSSMGEAEKNISVAIVISSVGATGSGSLERLLELVVGAAQLAGISGESLHCDVFILQPGVKQVTDLGLANTVALYSELAASRIIQGSKANRRYQGRMIMMGWGDNYSLPLIQQLQEVTATLIRIINDPISGIAAQYLQRVVDNHVLRDLDPQTGLPSHLSSTTAVTISLGSLEEQFIQYDTARLFDAFVLSQGNSDSTGEHTNIFNGVLTEFLNGNEPRDRYEHLLDYIAEGADLQSFTLTANQLKRGSVQEQANRLRGLWNSDVDKVTQQGRAQMQQRGQTAQETASKEIQRARIQGIEARMSLSQIRKDYEEFQTILVSVQREAQRYEAPSGFSNDYVQKQLEALEQVRLLGKQKALDNALAAVRGNLRNLSFRTMTSVAGVVLRSMSRQCAQVLVNLNTVINDARRVTSLQSAMSGSSEPVFKIESDHLLRLMAFSDDHRGVQDYYRQVSIFAKSREEEDDYVPEELQESDPLAKFRQSLKNEKKLELLFDGDFQILSKIVQDYTSRTIHERIMNYSLLDVLLHRGQDMLYHRLSQAAEKSGSLVSFNKNLAPKSREVRHVIAYYRPDQRKVLQAEIDRTFRQGECTLVQSDDPTEIVVFYYVDGLPISAVNDISGRCLDAFLRRRLEWYRQIGSQSASMNGYNNSATVPVYSGKDAEELVRKTGIIRRLYKVRNRSVVKDYNENEVLELAEQDRLKTDAANLAEQDNLKNNGHEFGYQDQTRYSDPSQPKPIG